MSSTWATGGSERSVILRNIVKLVPFFPKVVISSLADDPTVSITISKFKLTPKIPQYYKYLVYFSGSTLTY